MRNRDRRNYSPKTALVAQLASEFNLEVELKNIIFIAFRFFEFLHSQGQNRKSRPTCRMSVLPPGADLERPLRHVRKVPLPDSCTAAKGLSTPRKAVNIPSRW